MIRIDCFQAWTSRLAAWVATAIAMLGVILVTLFVDLSPRVEGDFFFAEDDPQMQASRAVSERFPSSPQVIIRVEDRADESETYQQSIAELTEELFQVEGIAGGFSIATNNPEGSPLFSRILLTPNPAATNIILETDNTDPEILLPRIEAAIDAHESSDLDVMVSGVPVIVELIRRSLYRDLVTFSLAAVLIFGLIIGLLYRDIAIVVGTLATCFISVSLTLIVVQALGIYIGLLTANLVTIVFVLTLSHVIFLTANWKRAVAEHPDRGRALRNGVRDTLEASFWSMTTTLLGFVSLLIASARPLRELGIAGIVGTLVALLVAYAVYPAFLGRWVAVHRVTEDRRLTVFPGHGLVGVGTITVAVAFLAIGTVGVDTDARLLTYFSEGTELRDGLEQIDEDGGSSTLDIVVRDSGGERVDSRPVFEALEVFQDALDADSAVGVVVSPTSLVGHARTLPLAGLLPLQVLLDIASGAQLDSVALGYVTPERDEAHFFLRMHEAQSGEPREVVMDRLRSHAVGSGLETVVIAGLYDLQAQLGRLIASSLKIGIGGLLLLFFMVALVVSRSGPTAVKMWLCLAAIPLVVLGTFGHLGIAIDIITSPAANIALAIGADSMIHLVVRVRRLDAAGEVSAWNLGVAQIGGAVLRATGIIAAGFSIFALSTFPPTQRFGLAVILGSAAAAAMALVVLPRLVGQPEPPASGV